MHPTRLGFEIAGGLVVLFTLLPLVRHDYWTFRIFDYPRLQKLAINLILLSLYPLLVPFDETSDYVLMGILAANAGYLFYQIFPFTFLAKKCLLKADKIDSNNGLSILSSNVFQDNQNTQGCMRLIEKEDPDIVLLLETNQFWLEGTKALAEKYPHQVLVPLENTYGMLLYSKLRLIDPEVRYLVDEEIPSIVTMVELPSEKQVCLYCVHPTPPVPGENTHSTERDKELLIVAKEVKEKPCPTIVVGDLNDVAWSYTTELFTKISGLLDPRVGRGFYNTFHAKYPFLRFPLDHVFCSTDFKLIRLARLHNFDSDHFPILIGLQYEMVAAMQQEEPEAEQEDLELAEEKIAKENPS